MPRIYPCQITISGAGPLTVNFPHVCECVSVCACVSLDHWCWYPDVVLCILLLKSLQWHSDLCVPNRGRAHCDLSGLIRRWWGDLKQYPGILSPLHGASPPRAEFDSEGARYSCGTKQKTVCCRQAQVCLYEGVLVYVRVKLHLWLRITP
jgi:hypothetical protein